MTELSPVDTKRKEMVENELTRGNPEYRKIKAGSVEVISGSMFSGKTDELMRRLRRAEIAKYKVQVFKPDIDIRFSENNIASHSGGQFDAIPVGDVVEILELLDPLTSVLAIDEAQFFEDDIIPLVHELANNNYRVVVAGLDTDFRGEPFGPMPILMAQADKLHQCHAICMVCGSEATRTQRLIDGKPAKYDDPIVVVGASEFYEARCRIHHEVAGKPQTNIKVKKNE